VASNNHYLQRHYDAMRAAQKDMTEAMVDIWPVGTEVQVLLSVKQYRPTPGTVVSHNQNYLRVRLDTVGAAVKDVHFTRVV